MNPGRYPPFRTLSPGRLSPSGPILPNESALIQDGYDQAVDTMTVPPSTGALFPRTLDGKPVRVELPGVTPGNILEVDLRLNLQQAEDQSYATEFGFQAIALVTFDGSEPAFPSAATFFVMDSWTSADFLTPGVIKHVESMSSLAAVEIPLGAKTAIVEVLYFTDGDVIVGGTTSPILPFPQEGAGLSASLKVSEYNGKAVSQLGPGVLQPTT